MRHVFFFLFQFCSTQSYLNNVKSDACKAFASSETILQFSHSFSLFQIDLLIHFYVYSNAKKPSCFYPIPQAADCILRVIERADAPIIYLSTDAAESETGLLQKLIVLNGKPVPLVIRPARNSAEKWDALLYRHGIEGDSQVR
jgi:hypothetical protein